MAQKTKLELTWIGKDIRPRLEPRILLEDPEKSYHAKEKVTDHDIFDNRLIFGDNLLALKALEQEFAGKIKCVFIDPPYNTGYAFTQFDDGVEHSIWLSLMRDRLEMIRRLLSDKGSVWITIDDNEAHYLKILCDEIFGRAQFVTTAIWEKTTSARNDAEFFSSDHDYILIYAKNIASLKLNGLARTKTSDTAYSNPDNDPRGPWREGDYKCAKTADERPNLYYAITHPRTGEDVWPRRTAVWRYSKETHQKNVEEGRVWWGKTGNYALPKLKRFRSDAPSELIPRTLWFASEVGQTRTAKGESKDLVPDDPFGTPKPEALLQRVVQVASNRGELVLDSFAGSGTTGAVAHKMGRRWIMVELGDHIHTHVLPRMIKVVNGNDPGGITESEDWKGGGGFRYYRLAPSLIEKDRFGNPIISAKYNAAMLAEAMCKVMGYQYAPNDQIFWQQGHSTENDYLYVTTQTLTHEQLAQLTARV